MINNNKNISFEEDKNIWKYKKLYQQQKLLNEKKYKSKDFQTLKRLLKLKMKKEIYPNNELIKNEIELLTLLFDNQKKEVSVLKYYGEENINYNTFTTYNECLNNLIMFNKYYEMLMFKYKIINNF